MTLFIERGYEEVTVADIAQHAGLTKRSFFNHFADKREVVFASADAFADAVLAELAGVDQELDPLDAAVWAYTQAAAQIEQFPDLARARRELIDSSPELQERALMKMASMTTAVAEALVRRGVSRRDAMFVSQAATTVFTTAVDEWAQEPEHGLTAAIQRARNDLRAALGPKDSAPRSAGAALSQAESRSTNRTTRCQQ